MAHYIILKRIEYTLKLCNNFRSIFLVIFGEKIERKLKRKQNKKTSFLDDLFIEERKENDEDINIFF